MFLAKLHDAVDLHLRIAGCLLVGVFVNALLASEPPRRWTDQSGKFSIVANLIERNESDVVLQKEDGTKVKVPVSKLSARDQDHLRQLPTTTRRAAGTNAGGIDSLAEGPNVRGIAVLSTGGRAILLDFNSMAGPTPADTPPADWLPAKSEFVTYRQALEPNPSSASKVASLPLRVDRNRTVHAMSIHQRAVGDFQKAFGRIYVVTPDGENNDVPVIETPSPIQLMDHRPGSETTLALYGADLLVIRNLASRKPEIIARWRLPNAQSVILSQLVENAWWVDEEHVVVESPGGLYCWSLATGQLHFKIEGSVTTVQPGPTGRYLAIGAHHSCFLLDAQRAEPIGRIDIPRTTLPAMRFSANGQYLAILDVTLKGVRIWDLPQARFVATAELEKGASSFYGWIDNRLLLFNSGLYGFDADSGAVDLLWPYFTSATKMRLQPGGALAVTTFRTLGLAALPIPHRPGIAEGVTTATGNQTVIRDGQWVE